MTNKDHIRAVIIMAGVTIGFYALGVHETLLDVWMSWCFSILMYASIFKIAEIVSRRRYLRRERSEMDARWDVILESSGINDDLDI